MMIKHNECVERTGGSRFARLQFERHWRLPPVAHADRWAEAVRWGQPGMFFALFILSDPQRSRRLCVLFFNAEAAETTEFRREFEFGAL